MSKTCVIGWPIAHSRSPLIHNYWLARHGIVSRYEARAVEPGHLASFLSHLAGEGLIGCNVTIPHKETAHRLVDAADQIASRLGAVNTLYICGGKLLGTNTDGEGFLGSLASAHPDFVLKGASAVILGAGGSARAVIGALLDAGVERIGIINRTPARIAELTKVFGANVGKEGQEVSLADCDLLIQTTSLGMQGQPPLDFDFADLNPGALVADLIYAPLKTAFLEQAEAQGHLILPGLGMLLHQAVRGFELWHGVRPEVTAELYDLVAADVAKVQSK